jgi:hypothetical protein
MFSSFKRTNFSVASSEFTRSRSRATGQRFGLIYIGQVSGQRSRVTSL